MDCSFLTAFSAPTLMGKDTVGDKVREGVSKWKQESPIGPKTISFSNPANLGLIGNQRTLTIMMNCVPLFSRRGIKGRLSHSPFWEKRKPDNYTGEDPGHLWAWTPPRGRQTCGELAWA